MAKTQKLRGDASVFIAVNVPASNKKEYEAHTKRSLRLLSQAGYTAHAMTGEFILKMADDIRAELARAEKMEAHIAAINSMTAAHTGQTEGQTDGTD